MKAVDTQFNNGTLSDFQPGLPAGVWFFQPLPQYGPGGYDHRQPVFAKKGGQFRDVMDRKRKNNRFRGIINDQVNTCCGFNGTDISTFTANDGSFDLITFEVENGDGIFNGLFSRSTLYGLNYDLTCFLVGLQFGLFYDLPCWIGDGLWNELPVWGSQSVVIWLLQLINPATFSRRRICSSWCFSSSVLLILTISIWRFFLICSFSFNCFEVRFFLWLMLLLFLLDAVLRFIDLLSTLHHIFVVICL